MKFRIKLVFLAAIFTILGIFLIFPGIILDQIKLMVYTSLIPYDIVFDSSVDKSEIDASQIINCLHGGGCPKGITYINDETGLPEEREIIPNKQQPVPDYSPESQGIQVNNIPINLQNSIPNADNVSYFLFGMIIISLIGGAILVIKKKRLRIK